MLIDETTLIEIQDYINELDNQVGLSNETLQEIKRAINQYRKDILPPTTKKNRSSQ